MPDTFQDYMDSLTSPAENAFSVTPSDDADLPYVPRALFIGGSGDITVNMLGEGSGVVFTGVSGIIAIRPSRVLATGTTATNIVALY